MTATGKRRSSQAVALATLALMAALSCSPAVAANDYPSRPIQLVVPYAAGGTTDVVARALASGAASRLGQPIVVINRPGASTMLGTTSVARAEPDGYTLLLTSIPFVTNFYLFKEVSYSQQELAPVALLCNSPSVLVVHPSFPAKTLPQLVAHLKANPGKVNYASFGVGSSAHLAALQLEMLTNTQAVHIPYRGGSPAAVAVMTGEVDMTFNTPASVMPGISAGKMRALGVASRSRLEILPDVPTFAEQGVDYVNGAWFAVFAPASTPPGILERLNGAVVDTLKDASVRKTIIASGNEIVGGSPQQLREFLAAETRTWGDILGRLGDIKQ